MKKRAMSGQGIPRRDVLSMGAAALGAGLVQRAPRAMTPRPKRVVVAGAGIAGLSCAYELMKRGHEVRVLEASGRTGGHVLTVRDQLADGLYVDAGAENFTKPGYDLCWNYIREFQITALRQQRHDNMMRRIDGKWYTEEMLQDRNVLSKLGFNRKEIGYLAHRNRWSWDITGLYLDPYVDDIEDEYRPLDAGLNHLDRITVSDLLEQDGASAGALRFGSFKSDSALSAIWHYATWKLQGAASREVYRLKGGNQMLPDALASRLGDHIWLGCPIQAIEQGETGVTVRYREFGREEKTIDADYLVSCIPLPQLLQIPVTPAWPAEKAYAISNIPYYSMTRVFFQSRTRFWEDDGLSPNLSIGDRALGLVWSIGEDVDTSRGLLMGGIAGAGAAEAAVEAFRRYYPGKSENIEQAQVVVWPQNRWTAFCERILSKPGELPKLWPMLAEPHGRIHFAGAYADTGRGKGMHAATRSAHRAVAAIEKA